MTSKSHLFRISAFKVPIGQYLSGVLKHSKTLDNQILELVQEYIYNFFLGEYEDRPLLLLVKLYKVLNGSYSS